MGLKLGPWAVEGWIIHLRGEVDHRVAIKVSLSLATSPSRSPVKFTEGQSNLPPKTGIYCLKETKTRKGTL